MQCPQVSQPASVLQLRASLVNANEKTRQLMDVATAEVPKPADGESAGNDDVTSVVERLYIEAMRWSSCATVVTVSSTLQGGILWPVQCI
jgi:hypothetical protein